MDHPRLMRRPLPVLEVLELMKKPFSADAITNRIRRIRDKPDSRDLDRAGYNRRQVDLYKRRPKQRQGERGKKRRAPRAIFGSRLRTR